MTDQEVVVRDPRPSIDSLSMLPPSGRGRGLDWEWIAEQVRINYPHWCEVGVFNPSVATHIRRGQYKWVKPEEFEVATRKTKEPNRARVFLRLRDE